MRRFAILLSALMLAACDCIHRDGSNSQLYCEGEALGTVLVAVPVAMVAAPVAGAAYATNAVFRRGPEILATSLPDKVRLHGTSLALEDKQYFNTFIWMHDRFVVGRNDAHWDGSVWNGAVAATANGSLPPVPLTRPSGSTEFDRDGNVYVATGVGVQKVDPVSGQVQNLNDLACKSVALVDDDNFVSCAGYGQTGPSNISYISTKPPYATLSPQRDGCGYAAKLSGLPVAMDAGPMFLYDLRPTSGWYLSSAGTCTQLPLDHASVANVSYIPGSSLFVTEGSSVPQKEDQHTDVIDVDTGNRILTVTGPTRHWISPSGRYLVLGDLYSAAPLTIYRRAGSEFTPVASIETGKHYAISKLAFNPDETQIAVLNPKRFAVFALP